MCVCIINACMLITLYVYVSIYVSTYVRMCLIWIFVLVINKSCFSDHLKQLFTEI